MSLLKSIKQQLGLGPAAENHFWDGSVANQLSLKRGTPDAPGTTVIQVANGKIVAAPDARVWESVPLAEGNFYTNDTELPMPVSLKITSSINTLMTGNIIVDGVSVAQCSFPAVVNSQVLTTLFAIVPVGAQFSVNWTGAVNVTTNLYKV